jgi:hypothetical protein
MSDAKLDRVREDLAVMKQVVGLRQPCERDQLWTNLALAGLGVIIAVVTACTQGSATPPVRGSLQHLASVAAIVVPGLIAVATLTAVSYRRREQAPVSWRENRQSGIVVALLPFMSALLCGRRVKACLPVQFPSQPYSFLVYLCSSAQ